MHHEKKLEGVEETYTIAWEEKTRNIAKIIQNRIYVKDQKTYVHLSLRHFALPLNLKVRHWCWEYSKFRASHLAQIHHLQSIPGNQHPNSMGNMRHEMSEKYTAAIKDMTSETRLMLTIYVFHNISHFSIPHIPFTLTALLSPISLLLCIKEHPTN